VVALHKAAQVLLFLVLPLALHHILVIMEALELTDLAAAGAAAAMDLLLVQKVLVYQAAETVQVQVQDRLELLTLEAAVVGHQAKLLPQVVRAVQVLQALLIGHKKQIMIWLQPIGIYL
jgi:hypothetical protein